MDQENRGDRKSQESQSSIFKPTILENSRVLFVTIAQSVAPEGCLDSLDVSAALLGQSGAIGRDHLLQQDNGGGNFGLRTGDWKLVRIENRGKSQAIVSSNERPLPTARHTLYQLSSDPGERTDVSATHPEIVRRLTSQLDQLISDGRSRRGE